MGVFTNGQICYGIIFEEGYEFPWNSEDFDGDIEEWWLVESGWEYEDEKPFEQYSKRRRDWEESHPLPVKLVNYSSSNYPAYVLACPSSEVTVDNGYTKVFKPNTLIASGKELNNLLQFCEKYGLLCDNGPDWILSSYWG
jgi:hypothetical protein